MREFKANSFFIIRGNVFFTIEENELIYYLNKIRNYSITIKIENDYLNIAINDKFDTENNSFIMKFPISKLDYSKLKEKTENIETIVFTDLTNAEFSKPFNINANLKKYLQKLFKDIKEINQLEELYKKSI